MTLKFVYKIFPALIFEIDNEDDLSFTFLNFIFLNKNESKGVLEHELIHIRQNYRTLGFATLLYKFSQKYRLMYEVEAFKKQIEVDKVSDLGVIRIANSLADSYNIDYVSVDDIFASLKG